MNEGLAQMFRYNRWANRVLIEACAALPHVQLEASVPGTFGSIEATLHHLAEAQDVFLTRLHSDDIEQAARTAAWRSRTLDFRILRDEVMRSSDALLAEAEAFEHDADVPLPPFQGLTYLFPRSFLLLHALYHGIEHRGQICTTLTAIGVTPPDLDGWGYALAHGLGRPAP